MLNSVEDAAATAKALTSHAGSAIGLHGAEPDALIVITAAMNAIRYDAIAYRLILLTAGCLMQNMYLAASVLNLAGCAVGAGMPEYFASASGADLLAEPSIVEFALSGGSER